MKRDADRALTVSRTSSERPSTASSTTLAPLADGQVKRFLVADEVASRKTMVAKRVIARPWSASPAIPGRAGALARIAVISPNLRPGTTSQCSSRELKANHCFGETQATTASSWRTAVS